MCEQQHILLRILTTTIQGGFQMKLRRMLVFSVVIVSLTLVAIAAPDVKEFDLKFKGEGAFDVVYDEDLEAWVYIPLGGPELLNVSHLGL